MTKDNSQTWTFKGYSGYTISSITASVKNNKSSGAGSATLKNNGTSITLTKSSFSGLGDSYSSQTLLSGSFVCAGDIVLTFSCSTNSFYTESVTFNWEGSSNLPSLSNITSTASHLTVGDATGLTLSTTATNRGSNVVTWSASPSTGVSFSGTSATGEATTVKFPNDANALAGGTKVTITASLTGATSQTYVICAITHAGTISDPYTANEAKYIALDGETGTHYIGAYIAAINGTDGKNVWLTDSSTSTTGDFELYNGYSNGTGVTLAVHYFILAHGPFSKYNTTAQTSSTSAVIDRVDYVALAKSSLEVNNTQTGTLSVSSAGGDIAWSTVAGTGSVSLSNQSNSGVTITGTSVGTATVKATVGTYTAECEVTILEYASDWAFKSITLSTGSGFVSSYEQGATFDKTGITVTYVEHSDTLNKDREFNRTDTATYNFDENKNTIGQFNLTATYDGHTTTDIVTITITKAVAVINFGSTSGHFAPTAAGPNSHTDNYGNSVTATITTSGNVTQSGQYTSIGKSGVSSEIIVTVTLSSRAGIDKVGVSAKTTTQSGSIDVLVYADEDVNNVILSGTRAQSTDELSTDNHYQKINATKICYKFSANTGIMLYSINYITGTTVQEFGTLSSIAIKNTSTHETLFKVGQTFSSGGLIIVATDTVGFTKEFTSGFETTYDDHVFVAGDVGEGIENTVSLTIGLVTKQVSYTFDVINPPTYSVATDLYEGMKVILVDTAGYAVGAYGSNQYGVITNMTASDGVVTDSKEALEFTIRIYGDKFGLQYGSKYVSYSGASNDAYQSSTLGDNESWKLDENGLLWCGDESAGRYLQINGTLKAACYTGSQKHLSLYASSGSTKTDILAAETFIYRYLHMRDYLGEEGQDGLNYCLDTGDGDGKNYFDDAATAYASLSSQAKIEFKKNTEAVNRFNAWASANHKTINLDTGVVSGLNEALPMLTESNNAPIIITVISVLSLTALGGFFFIKKRKEQ